MLVKIHRVIETIILILIFILTSSRSFIFWGLFPDTVQITGLGWREIFIWVLVFLLMIYIMRKQGFLENFLMVWGKRPILLLFISYAMLSVFWSVTWTGTLYRSLDLLFASVAAVYLSQRYSLEEFLKILYWVGVVFIAASFILIIFNPDLGRDLKPPYNGAWRGIFWHKNHLGNVISIFSVILLLRISQPPLFSLRFEKITAVLFYLLSLILIYQARSASGYILFLLLHSAFFISVVWIKISPWLKPSHYWTIFAIILAGSVLIIFNLEFVFGLFNRSASLTGRVPLWQYLINDVFLKKPIFGYGFGSLWTLESFRISTQEYVGWGYQVMIGDNGFLDILLNGGIVGLVLFILVYIRTWVVSVRHSIAHRTIIDMFPIIFMIYTLFVNISFSMFLETESLVWLLCIYMLFMDFPTFANNMKQLATL